MSEIYKNKRFTDDLSLYSNAIDKIADEQEKLAAKKLLSELIYEVKKMDNMYSDLVYSRSLGTAGNEFRDKIGSIRKQLKIKLKL